MSERINNDGRNEGGLLRRELGSNLTGGHGNPGLAGMMTSPGRVGMVDTNESFLVCFPKGIAISCWLVCIRTPKGDAKRRETEINR